MILMMLTPILKMAPGLLGGQWRPSPPMNNVLKMKSNMITSFFQLIVTSNTLYIATAINLGEKLFVSHVEYSRPALCVREVFAAF